MGGRPSATTAIVARKKTTGRKKELPKAAKRISDNSYMDDITDSVPSQ